MSRSRENTLSDILEGLDKKHKERAEDLSATCKPVNALPNPVHSTNPVLPYSNIVPMKEPPPKPEPPKCTVICESIDPFTALRDYLYPICDLCEKRKFRRGSKIFNDYAYDTFVVYHRKTCVCKDCVRIYSLIDYRDFVRVKDIMIDVRKKVIL